MRPASTRDDFKVDVGSEGLPRVCTRRIASRPAEIGRGDEDLPVEATGTKEGGVEVLQAVRRRDDDDTVGLAEPVELDEQLIQRLIVLAVEARARAACRRRRARR